MAMNMCLRCFPGLINPDSHLVKRTVIQVIQTIFGNIGIKYLFFPRGLGLKNLFISVLVFFCGFDGDFFVFRSSIFALKQTEEPARIQDGFHRP